VVVDCTPRVRHETRDRGSLVIHHRSYNALVRFETERRLLYVARTRVREHLLLTGVEPTSEYLADLGL
jgi:ATP-dependent exoDNAse (exonuclease V) beta subunit